jgi:hypothetical protein
MRRKAKTERLKERVCSLLSMSSDEYIEMWHRLGRRFAGNVLIRQGLTGNDLKKATFIYISSPLFWQYWDNEWVQTCDWFLCWGYDKKSIDDFEEMQLQARKPGTKIHLKILGMQEGSKQKAMDNIVERANRVEGQICEALGIGSKTYVELWYESGCTYAENLFKKLTLNKETCKRMVDMYIRSEIFWYFWAKNWLRACEYMLNAGYRTRRMLNAYISITPEPTRNLHKEILMHSKNLTGKVTKQFYKNI